MTMPNSSFCPECGTPLAPRRIAGETRRHGYCERCRQSHHDHPTIVATTFIAHEDRLLWVRRAIQPKQGLWAIPGGYVEQGEPLRVGAARELREEAGLVIEPDALHFYMLGTLTFINQIYVGFRGRVTDPGCDPGPESLEARFFNRRECPWGDVAYPEVNEAVLQAYEDLERDSFEQWHVEMTADSYQRTMISSGPLEG